MPVLEIQIPWSAVARPIIGDDEPGYIYIYITYISIYIYIYWVINEHADRCALDRPLAPFSDRPWSTDNLLRFKRRQPKRCGLAAKPLLLRILW